jgi:hypothetical protein
MAGARHIAASAVREITVHTATIRIATSIILLSFPEHCNNDRDIKVSNYIQTCSVVNECEFVVRISSVRHLVACL